MPTMTRNDDRLLKVPEACQRLALSRSQIYALMEAGQLPHARLPGTGTRFSRRIPLSAIEAFVARSMIGGSRD